MAHGDTAPPTRLIAEGDTVDGKIARSSTHAAIYRVQDHSAERSGPGPLAGLEHPSGEPPRPPAVTLVPVRWLVSGTTDG
jgi:hypothetical protein